VKRLVVAIAVCSATLASAGTPHVGVMADVGAPDGAMSSLVVRPLRSIELSGGIGYNLISTGYRAGIMLVPFHGIATPTLSVDYGQFPEGDANHLAQQFDPSISSSFLEHVGYRYLDAHVGLMLGSAHMKFFLRAGASRITSELRDTQVLSTMDAGDVTVSSDSHVTAWTVSGRLGIAIYLR
jgi:hypothetical protein